MRKIKHIIWRKEKSPEIHKAELQEHSNKVETHSSHSGRHLFHIPNFFSKISAAILQARENVRRKKQEKQAARNKQQNENGNVFKKAPRIDFFRKQAQKIEQRREAALHRKQKLKIYLQKAGIDVELGRLTRIIFDFAIIVNLGLSAYLIYHFSTTWGITWGTIAAAMAALWVLIFIALILLLWVFFYFMLDLKIFKRKVLIEDVLADYLQLTAANIRAGMTVDKALWYAVRPRFGVLAKEIEIVAKETMSGVDLKEALEKFAAKYDSMVLKRSINLLIEGLDSGGEIGDLLNRIANNIQEQKLMFREMAANVTTYAIFITFSSIVAAPFLFALSGSLIGVIRGISGTLGTLTNAAVSSGLPLTFGQVGITTSDFRIFSILSLIIGSTFSAMVISTIKKGEIRSGVKYIPIFVITAVSLYLIFQKSSDVLLGFVF